jgi:hypothetical protein
MQAVGRKQNSTAFGKLANLLTLTISGFLAKKFHSPADSSGRVIW